MEESKQTAGVEGSPSKKVKLSVSDVDMEKAELSEKTGQQDNSNRGDEKINGSHSELKHSISGSSDTQPAGAEAVSTDDVGKTKKKKSKTSKEEGDAAGTSKAGEKDKEFEVPLTAINKILKAALPDGAVCTKDAKSAFSKAAGIFVLYVTACANDLAKSNKRQTITAPDIMSALTELGYGSFIPHLEATLEKMKVEAAARKSLKEKKKTSEGESENPAPLQ